MSRPEVVDLVAAAERAGHDVVGYEWVVGSGSAAAEVAAGGCLDDGAPVLGVVAAAAWECVLGAAGAVAGEGFGADDAGPGGRASLGVLGELGVPASAAPRAHQFAEDCCQHGRRRGLRQICNT